MLLLKMFVLFLVFQIIIEVNHGEPFSVTLDKLYNAGVIKHKTFTKIFAILTGADRRIKAGRYKLHLNMSTFEVLRILTRGQNLLVTIPEGVTLREIASILKKEAGVDSALFMELAKDTIFIRQLGIKEAKTLEGFLFPDTYCLYWGIKPDKVIKLMVKRFFEVFNDSLQRRAKEIGFSLYQAVIFASLIQAEAKVTSEMPIISSVYHNRLKKNLPLQCDPTIQYILPKRKPNLTYKDLKIKSPYNTYIHRGLPPGPICSPGKDAIIAALYPADTDYLYFVAKGDGTHIFSRTHKEHLAAKKWVRKFRKY